MSDIRKELDKLVEETSSDTFNIDDVPNNIRTNLDNWHWGSYGWVSPANLIFTATWRKYFYPNDDCCKIWAKDENNEPIEGGYSLRSEDESITIPVLAKYDLCEGFCSSNSGMQGSRAIEKMRNLKRINTDFYTSQRTLFDSELFANILNEINELAQNQALSVLKYEILIAKNIRTKRIKTNEALLSGTKKDFNVMSFLSQTADPELTKCVAAACFNVFFSKSGLKVEGVEDYKTAADARAQKPGDLSIRDDGRTLIAIEVKDKTQTIDWNNIDRAKKIITANPDLIDFIFVLENREATVTPVIQEMVLSEQFKSEPCNKITFLSLHDLYLLALAVSNDRDFSAQVGRYMTIAPSIKPETREKWLKKIKNST